MVLKSGLRSYPRLEVSFVNNRGEVVNDSNIQNPVKLRTLAIVVPGDISGGEITFDKNEGPEKKLSRSYEGTFADVKKSVLTLLIGEACLESGPPQCPYQVLQLVSSGEDVSDLNLKSQHLVAQDQISLLSNSPMDPRAVSLTKKSGSSAR